MSAKTPFGIPNLNFAPGISDEARRAAVSAFEAMAEWRSEMAATGERQNSRVVDKMATAAKAMGWPAEVVDATKNHMQAASKMQVQMMDQMMALWQEQVRQPDPGTAVKSMFTKMQSMPGAGFGAGLPGMAAMSGLGGDNMSNPLQFWMHVGEQWQKNWLSMMQNMSNGQGRK